MNNYEIYNFYDLIDNSINKINLVVSNHSFLKNFIKQTKKDIYNINDYTFIEILMMSLNYSNAKNNKIEKIDYINDSIASTILFTILKEREHDINSFIKPSSIDLSTASEIYSQIKILMLSKAYNLENIENETVRFLYNLYKDFQVRLCELKVLDYISLLFKILDSSLIKIFKNFYIEENVYKKFTYIEKMVYKKIIKDEKLFTFKSKVFEVEYSFNKVYGNINEVYLFTEQLKENKNLYDNTTLIYTNDSFIPTIKAVLDTKKIPYFFSEEKIYGTKISLYIISILNFISNNFSLNYLEQFYKDFIKLQDGFLLLNSLKVCLFKESYEKFINSMKNSPFEYLSFYLDKLEFRLPKAIYEIVEDSENNYAYFIEFIEGILQISNAYNIYDYYVKILETISKYVEVNEENLEILKVLKLDASYYSFLLSKDVDDIKNDLIIERIKKLNYKSNIKENSVLVKKFQNYEFLERPNNYIIGLSFDDFEVKVQDSAILRDEVKRELLFELNDYGYILFNKEKGKEKREEFFLMLKTLRKGSISFSYSFFDTKNNKDETASLAYTKLLLETGKEEILVESYYDLLKDSYYFPNLEPTQNIEETLQIKGLKYIETVDDNHIIRTFKMNASDLEKLDQCYLQYLYSKQYFFEFFKRDSLDWLPANIKGSFCHKILEEYVKEELVKKIEVKKSINENLFSKIFERLKSYYIEAFPYYDFIISRSLEEIKTALTNYIINLHIDLNETGYVVYDVEKKENDIAVCSLNEKFLKYDEKKDKIEYRLVFTGEYDRCDVLEKDGKLYYRIVDYKTGKSENCKSRQYFVYPKMNTFKDAFDIVFQYDFLFETKSKTNPLIHSKEEILIGEKNCEEILIKLINESHELIKQENKQCKFCQMKNSCVVYLEFKKEEKTDD